MKLKKQKLTPWFRATVTPVRNGVYQRKPVGMLVYSYWDGKLWYIGGKDPDNAVRLFQECVPSVFQNSKWRGIAEQSI